MAPSPLPALNLLRGTVSHSFSLGDAAHNRVAAGWRLRGDVMRMRSFAIGARLCAAAAVFSLSVSGAYAALSPAIDCRPRWTVPRASYSSRFGVQPAQAIAGKKTRLHCARSTIGEQALLLPARHRRNLYGTPFFPRLPNRTSRRNYARVLGAPATCLLARFFPNSAASNNKRRLRAPEQGFFSGDLEFGRAAPVPSARIRYRDPRRTLKALACRLPRGLRVAAGQAFLVSAAPVMPSVAGDGSGRLKRPEFGFISGNARC